MKNVIKVNHGKVSGGKNWYTFYCPECKRQMTKNEPECEHCKKSIRWENLSHHIAAIVDKIAIFGTCPYPQYSPECQQWHKQTDKTISSLKTVLDFVERWNKHDKEKDVAEAAQFLSTLKGE